MRMLTGHVKRVFSQKEKQERGVKGEALVTASLKEMNLWNHKFINAGFGTVFDKLVVIPGGGFALEVKLRKDPTIAYNIKSITRNERKGLDNFMNKVGKQNALIIGIWHTEEATRAFMIPWCQVREDVLSGRRGSINMLDFPELKKAGKGFDLQCLNSTG